jgi:hypothetical protein
MLNLQQAMFGGQAWRQRGVQPAEGFDLKVI